MVSFQYKLLSLRLNPPFSARLRTRRTTSPGSQSGLSSPSPSNTTSWPSGAPRGTSRVNCAVCSRTFWPEHAGHSRAIIRPRPPHLLQVTCDWANMPGKICCLTMRTPLPPHSGHEWISPSVAAPEPRQWSHNTRFLIMNWLRGQAKVRIRFHIFFHENVGCWDGGSGVGDKRKGNDIRQCLHPCRYLLEKLRTRRQRWVRGGPALVHGLRGKTDVRWEQTKSRTIVYVQPPPKNCENMSNGLAYWCWPPSWAFRPSSPCRSYICLFYSQSARGPFS